jgi:hypothetical protein
MNKKKCLVISAHMLSTLNNATIGTITQKMESLAILPQRFS